MSKYDREQILRTSGVNVLKCMRCGKCSATCPSYDEMEYHPHQFVTMVQKAVPVAWSPQSWSRPCARRSSASRA